MPLLASASLINLSSSSTSNFGTSDAPPRLDIDHALVSVPLVQNIRQASIGVAQMMTLKDLAEDWIEARAALKQHIKMLESDLVSSQAGLSEDIRKAVATRIHIALSELDALLKEFPYTEV
jgi:hypothetical protein